MAIVTASCLIVSQAAADDVITGVYLGGDIVFPGVTVGKPTMRPHGQATVENLTFGGGATFAVDSFFDVFTELGKNGASGDQWQIDSFFDITYEIEFEGGPSGAIGGDTLVRTTATLGQPFGNDPGVRQATFDTEIVSMSLTGDVGGLSVEIRESENELSAGDTIITRVGINQDGGDRFHIDSFFDVFTELSVDGGTPLVTESTRMTLDRDPSGKRCDTFNGTIVTGEVIGGGSGWNDGDWLTYPQGPDEPWINQWFYNDPLDENRQKDISWIIDLIPADVSQPGDMVEVAINWTNENYQGEGPPEETLAGDAFIERLTIFNGQVLADGKHLEGSHFIEDFNPEWVSIDVRMIDQISQEGVIINGDICHECVPEPATMSLLALGGLVVLRRRRRR